MSSALKAVLVGCGSVSNSWLKAVEGGSDVDIVGLVDINEAAATEKKTNYKLDHAATGADLRTMLGQTSPDVVFDCTVPEAHFPTTMTALEYGCHVLGEKPLADSMEHAREMVAKASEAGRVYAVIQNRRYQPEIRALKDTIASGRLGQLTTLDCDFYVGAHFGGFRDRMKHVLLLDMAIHTFDQARCISGLDPVGVYCREWNPSGSWYDHDASAVAVFEMTDGVVYTYRGSWCSEGLNTTWESDWRAVCERGSIKWDGGERFEAQVVSKTGAFFSEWEDDQITIPAEAKSGGHKGVIEEFVRCLRTGEVPETAAQDNIKSLAMVFAAIQSAESGRRVLADEILA